MTEQTQEQERTPRQTVEAAAAGKKLSAEEQSQALAWFLSDVPDPSESETKTLELNFGTRSEPKQVPWTIRPVDMDTMRAIRRRAMSRRGGELDEYKVNLEVVVAGTVDPDIRLAAKHMGIPDPAEALRIRIASKPGFVPQIAGEIMSLSGFDEDDVREAEAGKR